MSLKASTSVSFYTLVCLIVVMTSACVSVSFQEPQAGAEPATPTPEIFSALAPSPTPPDKALPLTCQVTDLGVYLNQEWGYCLAYPGTFTLDESRAGEGIITLYGPGLEDSADPVRVSLEITTQTVPEGSNLTSLVDAYVTSFRELSGTIAREPGRLGSEPSEMLEPVPGLLSSRVIMAVHHNILFTLRFHPSDIDFAKPDLDALTQTVTGSFAFLPGVTQPVSHLQTVSISEFGQNVSLSYDPGLVSSVEVGAIPAVPVNDQILFAESHPAYTQFRFPGLLDGKLYDLPFLPSENRVAQVIVFRTADFPGFGDESLQGFVNQEQALQELLKTGITADHCAKPLVTYEAALPFLPWTNARQALCAQPQIIEFAGGKGIRYLTYYAQDPSPVLDYQVFYTFQGLTQDGQFYVAAFFPVRTGIFPAEPPACTRCGDTTGEWMTLLTEQLTQLNALPEENVTPSLAALDEIVKSIQIAQR